MADHLTVGGYVLGKGAGVGGATVELQDQAGAVVTRALSNADGQFRLELRRREDPAGFEHLKDEPFGIVVRSADGKIVAEHKDLKWERDGGNRIDVPVASGRLRSFKPVAGPMSRLGGSLIDRESLDLLDAAVAMLVPPGQLGHNMYLRTARCPLPEIGAFSRLVDDAWGVLDGDPQAEVRYRETMSLLADRLPKHGGSGFDLASNPAAASGSGSALPHHASAHSHAPAPGSDFDAAALPAWSGGAAPASGRPMSIPSSDLHFDPCPVPPHRFGPVLVAAHHVASSAEEAAALVGVIEASLCGLGTVNALLGAAKDALVTGDPRRFQGALDFIAGECGPTDLPLPRVPERHGHPCPDLAFQKPDLCEVERRACEAEMVVAFRRLRFRPRYRIDLITPVGACVGTTIVITGADFGTQPGTVCFPSPDRGSVCTAPQSWTDDRIVAVVPAGAGSGPIYLDILDEVLLVCDSTIPIKRQGSGNVAFMGGGAAVSAIGVNGRAGHPWLEPGEPATVSWVADRGPAGATVRLRILWGSTTILDQSGLAASGTAAFTAPMVAVETTVRIEVTATTACGSATRTRDVLITKRSELTMQGIEVTQATQYYRSAQHLPGAWVQADNSVTLIENKRTLARVYVDSGLDAFDIGAGVGVVPGVAGWLHGTRDGVALPGSPLAAIVPVDARRNDPYADTRGAFDRTLNFELPPDWRTGTVTLRAEIRPGGSLNERRIRGPVSSSVAVSFQAARRLRLVGVMVNYTGWQIDAAGNRVAVNVAAPAYASLVTAANWLRRTYPINDVEFRVAPGNETIAFGGDLTDGSGAGCGTQWGRLMDRLRDLASDYSGDDDAVWVGVLPVGWNGSAWGGCGGGASGAVGLAVIFSNDTGPTLAQEAGHGYGRNHAPGCGAGGPDPGYPTYAYPSTSSIGEFGADIPPPGSANWQIQTPATNNDFMGYCGSDWVSPYTYMGLYNGGISPNSSVPAGHHHPAHAHTPPSDRPSRVAVVRAVVRLSGGIDVTPAFVFERTMRPKAGVETGLVVELCDGEGRSLEAAPLLADEPYDASHDAAVTVEGVLRVPPGTRLLRIRRDKESLYEQAVSATPPSPRAVVIDQKTRRGGKAEVSWSVKADSERCWHKLRYSPDDGATWYPLVTLTDETSATIDLSRLPGGERCVVEVMSTDGLATGRVRSKPFAVPHHAPTAVATRALTPAAVTGWVRLLGAGWDEVGLALPSESLRWMSDRDGDLGKGEVLDVKLSSGPHVITLEVTDARGVTARGSLEVRANAASHPANGSRVPGRSVTARKRR